jgi:hypothetical protein
MLSNTSMDTLRAIRFGYSFIANHKSLKLRFTTPMAQAIMNRLPKHFHNQLAIYVTQKNTTFIACLAYPQSFIWDAFEDAKRLAKADMLRTQADAIEHGLPMQLSLGIAVHADDDDLPF